MAPSQTSGCSVQSDGHGAMHLMRHKQDVAGLQDDAHWRRAGEPINKKARSHVFGRRVGGGWAAAGQRGATNRGKAAKLGAPTATRLNTLDSSYGNRVGYIKGA